MVLTDNQKTNTMARYKISNALYSCDPQEFNSDEEAWNTLRQKFHPSFQWLWKEVEIEVPVNNEESYVKAYNSKYGPKPIGYGAENAELMEVGKPNMETMWLPILRGITSDPYNVKTNVTKS